MVWIASGHCDSIYTRLAKMDINDFLSTQQNSELQNILRLQAYRSHIRSLKTGDGSYCYRVHNQQNQVTGRSRTFDNKADRDAELKAFITFIEVEIHGRLQMELF